VNRRAAEPVAAPLEPLETRSLSVRAKEVVRESIANGAFLDGLLPSEGRLADQLGVSRVTIREALRSLEEEGLITRRRGIGTRVNLHVAKSISLNRVVGFFDLIQEAGYEAEIAWTAVSDGRALPDIGRRLGRDGEGSIVAIERLFLADGEAALHVVENVLAETVTQPVDAAAVSNSIFSFAEAFCRAPIDHTVVEIIPTKATDTIAKHLKVDVGEPLLRLIETHYDVTGDPFIVSVIHVVDEFLRFTVVRRRY